MNVSSPQVLQQPQQQSWLPGILQLAGMATGQPWLSAAGGVVGGLEGHPGGFGQAATALQRGGGGGMSGGSGDASGAPQQPTGNGMPTLGDLNQAGSATAAATTAQPPPQLQAPPPQPGTPPGSGAQGFTQQPSQNLQALFAQMMQQQQPNPLAQAAQGVPGQPQRPGKPVSPHQQMGLPDSFDTATMLGLAQLFGLKVPKMGGGMPPTA